MTAADVLQASRALNRQALDTLATPLPAFGDWDSLAVSEETMRELRSLESRCRHRERLKHHVGNALHSQLTGGVRALLNGSSGTGKTLAARVLAGALNKDLYRLDLAAVVNKYIGETEKNLDAVFAEAEQSGAVLLFDEAEALFGKRSDVKDSHDRYANVDVSYLLQRIEAFDGVAILTSNLRSNIDEAFLRRLHFVVEFPPRS